MSEILCHLEATTCGVDSLSQRPSPWDQDGEVEIGAPASEVVSQPAALDQAAGHLSESITRIVLAVARSGNHAHRRVAHGCSFAVTKFQAEVNRSADDERVQVRVSVV